jgi:hypothetical protein
VPVGFIRCYGLFWSAEEVTWFPRAKDADGPFELLGRINTKRPNLKVCDFRPQQGIYVLYDHYGPYYVGLTLRQPLGKRLKDHLLDHHAGMWDRFSWFGFRGVLNGCHPDGTRKLGNTPQQVLGSARSTMRDLETLLMQSLGTQHRGNVQKTKFIGAEQWTRLSRSS